MKRDIAREHIEQKIEDISTRLKQPCLFDIERRLLNAERHDLGDLLKEDEAFYLASESQKKEVPVIPTRKMCDAGFTAYQNDNGEKLFPDFFEKVYSAMIGSYP